MDDAVNDWLAQTDIHEKWIDDYRNPENSRFYEYAFDAIVSSLDPPKNATILDAGCGNCAQSIRLARRNFNVVAVDFSDAVLAMARKNVAGEGLCNKIKIEKQDLCDMSFNDGTFKYALCWGVLMHIPNVEDAINELVRVVKPGGMIVISEGNDRSLDSIILMIAKLLLKQKGTITPSGIEYYNKETGAFLRQVNVSWLIREFEKLGCTLIEHRASQFTEYYTMMPRGPIYSMVQRLNNFWFKKVKNPGLSRGNLLIFRKKLIRISELETRN